MTAKDIPLNASVGKCEMWEMRLFFPLNIVLTLTYPYLTILYFFSHVSAAEAEEMAEKMRAHIRQDACCLRSVLSIPGESLLA